MPYCTMGVIHLSGGIAEVNEEECVECSTCYRSCPDEGRNPAIVKALRRVFGLFRLRYEPPMGVCPTGALVYPELEWPRSLRRTFSDPLATHEGTGVSGRGTEEIKTNDVTARLGDGDAGLVVELGRPGLGARFRDIERVAVALAQEGVSFEEKNPVTQLMKRGESGALREDILEEKVLSAIIEAKVKLERLPAILKAVEKGAEGIETVLSLGVSTRCRPDGGAPTEELLRGLGYSLQPSGKTNLGLGKPGEGAER